MIGRGGERPSTVPAAGRRLPHPKRASALLTFPRAQMGCDYSCERGGNVACAEIAYYRNKSPSNFNTMCRARVMYEAAVDAIGRDLVAKSVAVEDATVCRAGYDRNCSPVQDLMPPNEACGRAQPIAAAQKIHRRVSYGAAGAGVAQDSWLSPSTAP
jgi:hypothetical protein